MIRELLIKLWKDECGAIVATEYLLLGSVVVVGGVSGMTTVRDSMNDEYKEFGNSVREVRQSYSVPARQGGSGSAGGTAVTAPRAAHGVPTDNSSALNIPVPPSTAAAQVTFSCP